MTANWPVRALALALGVASLVGAVAGGGGYDGPMSVVFGALVSAYLVVGLLIIERRAGNAVGPIILAVGSLIGLFLFVDALVRRSDASGWTVYLAWLVTLIDAPLFALLAFLFLLFPDGHLPSPRWRVLAWAIVGFGAVALVGTALMPGPFAYYPHIENPFGVADQWLSEVMPLFYVLTVVGVMGAALSLIGRWRVGDAIARAQLKWVALAAGGIAIVMTAYATLFGPGRFNDVADLAIGIAFGFFPIAIGIAILRYRLFEIDRLVSRSIAYALLTGGLLVMFLIVNLALTTAFSSITDVDSVSVAAATLLVAALFTPLRRRVQHVVDRRFDRARYDAERTTLAFSARLRDEVDLPAVTADLDATVRSAIAPTTLVVWLRDPAR